jgi:putative protease
MSRDKQPAAQPDAACLRLCQQLKTLGNTLFTCDVVNIQTQTVFFLPVSAITALKRGLVECLTELRTTAGPKQQGGVIRNDVPYPEKILTWNDNTLNQKASEFYKRHGVERIEPAAESGLDLRSRTVMTTNYWLRRQFGRCEKTAAPMVLEDEDGRQFRVRFLCGPCGMTLDWVK